MLLIFGVLQTPRYHAVSQIQAGQSIEDRSFKEQEPTNALQDPTERQRWEIPDTNKAQMMNNT
jgi:hypothetical protein